MPGMIRLDSSGYLVCLNGEEVTLTATEFRLLDYLTKGSALEILADLEARSQEPEAGMDARTFTAKESQEPGGMAPPRLNTAMLLKN